MNHIKFIFLYIFSFVFFLIMLFSCSMPQQRQDYPISFFNESREKFFADPVIFYDSDSLKARLDLFVEVPYENIIFKKNISSGKFELKLTNFIDITNTDNNTKISNIYYDSAAYSDNEMVKKSNEPQFYFYNYFLETGNYKIEIKIKDKNSKNEFKKSFNLNVKDFKLQDVSFSDPIILSQYKINEEGTKEITPLIGNNIFGLKEIFVFFEIYNNKDTEIKKDLLYKLKDSKDNIVKEDELKYTLSPDRNQKVEKILVDKELKKYLPEESDFDLFLYDNELNKTFNLEIIDKTNNIKVAGKKLIFFPSKPDFGFEKKTPMR